MENNKSKNYITKETLSNIMHEFVFYEMKLEDIGSDAKDLSLLCKYDIQQNKYFYSDISLDDYYSDIEVLHRQLDDFIETIRNLVNDGTKLNDSLKVQNIYSKINWGYNRLIDELGVYSHKIKTLKKVKIKPVDYLNRDKKTIEEAKRYNYQLAKYSKDIHLMVVRLAMTIRENYKHNLLQKMHQKIR